MATALSPLRFLSPKWREIQEQTSSTCAVDLSAITLLVVPTPFFHSSQDIHSSITFYSCPICEINGKSIHIELAKSYQPLKTLYSVIHPTDIHTYSASIHSAFPITVSPVYEDTVIGTACKNGLNLMRFIFVLCRFTHLETVA